MFVHTIKEGANDKQKSLYSVNDLRLSDGTSSCIQHPTKIAKLLTAGDVTDETKKTFIAW